MWLFKKECMTNYTPRQLSAVKPYQTRFYDKAPYTPAVGQLIRKEEEEVVGLLKKLKDHKGFEVNMDQLTDQKYLDKILSGKAEFRLVVNENYIGVQPLKKGKTGKAYSPEQILSELGVMKLYATRQLDRLYKQEQANLSPGQKPGGLENIVSVFIALACTFAGLFFMSGNITGYAVMATEAASDSASYLGLAMFVLGCVGVFLYTRKR